MGFCSNLRQEILGDGRGKPRPYGESLPDGLIRDAVLQPRVTKRRGSSAGEPKKRNRFALIFG